MNTSGGVRKQPPLFIYEESSFLIYKNAPLGMRTAAYKVGVAQECAKAPFFVQFRDYVY